MIPSRIENRAPRRRRQPSPATTVLLSLLALLVVACGNKGPLYLPDEPEPRSASEEVAESNQSTDLEPDEERRDPEAGGEEEENSDGGR